MAQKFDQFKTSINEISDIYNAIALLGWDQKVNMPHGGSENRGYVLSTLERIAHQKITSPDFGQLIEDAAQEVNQLAPESDEACLVKVARRDFRKRVNVPARWVVENALVTTTAQSVWEEAKSKSDFCLL